MFRGRGRGDASGRGRGNSAGRGRGALASAHKSPAAPAKRAAVPAFPVVARSGAAAAAASAAPVASSARHHDDGDDAPPAAVSARRGKGGDTSEESSGFVPPNAVRGRGNNGGRGDGFRGGARGGGRGFGRGDGFRGGRGGDGFRGGRGGMRGRGASQPPFRGGGRGRGRGAAAGGDSHQDEIADREEASIAHHEEKNSGPTRVITTVTDSGTELPRRLNTKVFIDGLPYNYPAEAGKPSLEDEVMQFATAWKVGKPLRLIKKPGQGFGFLVLQSPNSVATAVRVLNGRKFLGRALRVEEPKPKDLEKMKDIGGMKDMGKDSFTRQVLLTDLAKVAQPEIIREVLRDVAPQLEKKLEAIKMTSQNRKAFLTFESEAEVAPAINFLDGFHLLGRRISATQAAAPGSLPFSHGGTGPSRGGLAAAAAAAATSGGDAAHRVSAAAEEDEEVAVVPLGMEHVRPTPPSPAAAAKTVPAAAAARRRPGETAAVAAAASAAGSGSNVTGRTEKYNLLDDGPKDIYVGNLAEIVTQSQLYQHFAPCGAIHKCEMLVHPETHLSTGIAHIEFALPAYAAYAQERYHGSRLGGCVLRVDRGETPSVPLAAELPPVEDADDYDEDAYMERYGVKDKKAFFKGTSVAAEMGADPNFDDDDEDEEIEDEAEAVVAPAANAAAGKKKDKRQRAEDKKNKNAAAEKRARAEAAPSTGTASAKKKGAKAKSVLSPAAGGDDEDDEGDIDFITSGALDDDDDDEEEHFYDADTVAVSSSSAAAAQNRGGGGGKHAGKKAKGGASAKPGKGKKGKR